MVASVEWPKPRGSCNEVRLSRLVVAGVCGETSGLVRLNLLRGIPMVDRELGPTAAA